MQVKALACERPAASGRPLSRLSVLDLCQQVWEQGCSMSYSTVWRLLRRDALRPWFQRPWLFPRDPRLLERATPVLELYHRRWEGQPLGPRDVVLCADEMTGLQALARLHPDTPAGPGRERRYEFEYVRHDTLCYLAFLDVRTGRVSGETSPHSGIEPFETALRNCLEQPPYREAERIFLIVDNGSAHHPHTAPARIRERFPQVTVVHLPVHASWLNQRPGGTRLYFSIVHRKALHPADFDSLAALGRRLFEFQLYYNRYAQRFQWNYPREDLERQVARLAQQEVTGVRRREAVYGTNSLTH